MMCKGTGLQLTSWVAIGSGFSPVLSSVVGRTKCVTFSIDNRMRTEVNILNSVSR